MPSQQGPGSAAPGRAGARKTLPRNKRPTRDEILDAIDLEGLTTPARIAHKWGRSAQAGRTWLSAYGLGTEELVQQALEERKIRRDQEAHDPEPEVVEGELVDEGTELPALVASGPALAPNDEAEDEQRSAFERLSARQQKAALIISGFAAKLTNAEVAKKADVHEETIAEWRRDSTFQEAVLDLQEPLFRFESTLLIRQKLVELVSTGKGRPEDRRLLAELAGLIGAQGSIQVNFNKVEWRPNG